MTVYSYITFTFTKTRDKIAGVTSVKVKDQCHTCDKVARL